MCGLYKGGIETMKYTAVSHLLSVPACSGPVVGPRNKCMGGGACRFVRLGAVVFCSYRTHLSLSLSVYCAHWTLAVFLIFSNSCVVCKRKPSIFFGAHSAVLVFWSAGMLQRWSARTRVSVWWWDSLGGGLFFFFVVAVRVVLCFMWRAIGSAMLIVIHVCVDRNGGGKW